MSKISVHNVSHCYENFCTTDSIALKNINFEVKKGEFAVLVGESGCGKSTLLNIMAGLVSPSNGHITVNDEELKGMNSALSLVFQKSTLLPWLNIRENIAFGCKLRGETEELDDRVTQYMEMMGLLKYEKHYPQQLSVGMAKRVDIARALISNPKVLLLDEPFAPLDFYTARKLQDELIYIWQASEMSCVLVTHNIEDAVKLGQKIFIMRNNPGQIDRVIDIPLDYPRTDSQPEFIKLKKELLKHFGMTFL